MATLTLVTNAQSDGLYDNMPLALETETAAIVTLEISGLTLQISADNSIWPASGPVEYTMTISNSTGVSYDPPLAVTTDLFPTNLFTIDNSSVKLNGLTTGFTSSVTDGVLTVNLLNSVEVTPAVITFLVNKA